MGEVSYVELYIDPAECLLRFNELISINEGSHCCCDLRFSNSLRRSKEEFVKVSKCIAAERGVRPAFKGGDHRDAARQQN